MQLTRAQLYAVKLAVKQVIQTPGMIKIDTIREIANENLDQREQLNRRQTSLALATIIESVKE